MKTAKKKITTTIISSLQELEKYETSWNTLALLSPQRSPMNSWAWLSTYFEKRLLKDEEWFCVIAEDSDDLLGVLPLIVIPTKILGRTYRILRTPGDHHTIAIDMVIHQQYEKQVIPLLINAALKKYPSYSYLEFSQLVEQSPTLNWLSHHKHNFSLVKEHRGNGAYLKTNKTFDSFYSQLSKNYRSNLNKARNKLKKLPDVTIEFKEGTTGGNAQLMRMAAVEDKNWKGDAGTSILKSPELIDFYSKLCHRLARAGWLEWHFLSTAGQSIAANLAINFSGSITLWKLGYDESFKKCSPGSMLLERLIERACQSETIDEINLMTDMGWYANWKMEKRKYYLVRIYSLRLLPVLFSLVPVKTKYLLKRNPLARRIYSSIKAIRRTK